MKKGVLLLLTILGFVSGYGQNFISPIDYSAKKIHVGAFPTFLNYQSKNHFHLELQGSYSLNQRQRLLFTGGMVNGGRFEFDFQQLLVSGAVDMGISAGIGSFHGTFIDLDVMAGFKLGASAYLNNQIQVNLYLDASNNKPFDAESPLWYVATFTIPLNLNTTFVSEFGLPMVSDSFTWFGMGVRFNL